MKYYLIAKLKRLETVDGILKTTTLQTRTETYITDGSDQEAKEMFAFIDLKAYSKFVEFIRINIPIDMTTVIYIVDVIVKKNDIVILDTSPRTDSNTPNPQETLILYCKGIHEQIQKKI